MRLEPCGQCLRHVDVATGSCPFCGAIIVAPPPRVFLAGRFSRAAVIAGAALGSGCWTSSSPAPQQPPHDERAQPPPPPPDDGFAKPPDDKNVQAPVGSGIIRGVVVDASSKTPIQGVRVYAYPARGGNPLQAQSDSSGRWELHVPAGVYNVAFSPPARPNSRWEQAVAPGEQVTVADGAVERADTEVTYTVHAPPPPYGAPPPRRRVV